MKLLAVDIGNTAVKLALFSGNQRIRGGRVPSSRVPKNSHQELRAMLTDVPELWSKATEAMIVSVVPALTSPIEAAIRDVLGIPVKVVTHDTPMPLRNGYSNPAQAGLDRLANGAGGIAIVGAPVIIVDAGGAVNIDVISKDKVFLGGAIFPGADLWLQALSTYTSALPAIQTQKPGSVIGTTTEENLLSGTIYGLAGAIDRIVELTRAQTGKNTPAILTGGSSQLLHPHCKTITRLEDHLTLKGVHSIYCHK